MAGPVNMYFDVWDKDDYTGTSLGELTTAYAKKIYDPISGVGSGQFTMNKHSDEFTMARRDNLIRVRFGAGGPFDWDDARYMFAFRIEQSDDVMISADEQGGEEITRGGRSVISILERLVWWPTAFLTGTGVGLVKDGRVWRWEDATFGEILQRMIHEWNNRPAPGPIPTTLTRSFTDTEDTGGVTWEAFEAVHEIEIGTTYLQSVLDLADQGLEVTMTPDFKLHAWAAEGRGSDLSATVCFRQGWNIRDSANHKFTLSKRGTRALVRGAAPDDGEVVYVEATYSATDDDENGTGATVDGRDDRAWGRREIFVANDNTTSTPALMRTGREALRRVRLAEEGVPTIPVTSYADARLADQSDGLTPPATKDLHPYSSYDNGDIVSLDVTGYWNDGPHRISAITIDEPEDGTGESEVLLNIGLNPGSVDLGGGCCVNGPRPPRGSTVASCDLQPSQMTEIDLENGGGEDGVNTNTHYWVGGGAVLSFVTSGDLGGPHDGDYFVKAVDCGHLHYEFKGITFEAGTAYNIRFWMRSISGQFNISFGHDATEDWSNNLGYASLGLGWREYCFVWVPAVTHSSGVNLGVANTGGTVEIDWDNVRLYVGSAADETISLGGPGEGTTGDGGTYIPGGTVIEHGDLSGTGGTMHDATQVEYDNSTSGMAAVTEQEAIDELDGRVDDLEAATGPTDYLRDRGGGEDLVDLHGAAGATETIDPEQGNWHALTLDANLTLTITNPAAGVGATLLLELTQDATGGRTLTLPASVTNGSDLEAGYDTTANSTSFLLLWTRDTGTTWYGSWVGGNTSAVGALDDLSDVTVTTPAEGDVLRHNGTTWVNSALRWEPVVTDTGSGPEIVFTSTDIVMTWADYS